MVQVSWLVEYVPPWLSSLLLFSGFILILFGILEFVGREYNLEMTVVGSILISTGIGCLFLKSYSIYPDRTVFLFVIAVKWLEGVAAIRFYQKLVYSINNRRLPPGSNIKKKALKHLLLIFIVIAGGWFGILVLSQGPVLRSLAYDLAVIWTIGTVLISITGLMFKFWSVKGSLSGASLLGFTMAATGAEIYNFRYYLQEISSFLAGNLSYSIGFWIAAGLWLRRTSQPTEDATDAFDHEGSILSKLLLLSIILALPEREKEKSDFLATVFYYFLPFLVIPIMIDNSEFLMTGTGLGLITWPLFLLSAGITMIWIDRRGAAQNGGFVGVTFAMMAYINIITIMFAVVYLDSMFDFLEYRYRILVMGLGYLFLTSVLIGIGWRPLDRGIW